MEFGLIGSNLSYSYSQRIHNLLGTSKYIMKEFSEEKALEFLKSKDFSGINVTIPYKKTFINYIDVLDEISNDIKVVNTIINKDNKLYGYNTDYYGFDMLIKHNNIILSNLNVLVLGTGATSLTITKYLNDNKVNKIYYASTSKKEYNYDLIDTYKDNIDIIINTTPYNTYPSKVDKALIDVSSFKNLKVVIDLIYNPYNTRLLLDARNNKIKAINGLYMLIAQAYKSECLFLNKKLDEKLIDEVYKKVLLDTTNIVLIGMPYSGKSTIGSKLAKNLKKNQIDTDKLIEQRINMPINKYLNKDNEVDFRKIESNIIKGLESEKGKIISTGGGVVLDKSNIDLLKENGIVIYLDKKIDEIVIDNSRPLISNYDDLKKTYLERKQLYLDAADYVISIVDNNLAVKKILFEMRVL